MSEELSRLLLTIGLAILLIISSTVGVYAIITLSELRRTMKRTNIILDSLIKATDTLIKPAFALTSVIKGLKEGSTLIKKIIGKA